MYSDTSAHSILQKTALNDWKEAKSILSYYRHTRNSDFPLLLLSLEPWHPLRHSVPTLANCCTVDVDPPAPTSCSIISVPPLSRSARTSSFLPIIATPPWMYPLHLEYDPVVLSHCFAAFRHSEPSFDSEDCTINSALLTLECSDAMELHIDKSGLSSWYHRRIRAR